ncbi:MAG TPA: hypothetical protein GXZ45_12920 [Propionibacterium sp.]|nr:hypothetical protein [Propionibacterium sp.]
MSRYDFATTTVGTLLDDPEAVAVIEKRYPGLTRQPMVALMKGMSAQKAFGMAAGYLSEEELAAVRSELESL